MKYQDNVPMLNIDTIDGLLDAQATYRALFNKEPRFVRNISVKDVDIEDKFSVQKEVDNITSFLTDSVCLPFFKKECYSEEDTFIIVFYGEHFVIEISHWEFQSNTHFNFSIVLDEYEYESGTFKGLIDQYEKRIGIQYKKHNSKIYVINKTEDGLNLVNFPIRKNTSKEMGIEFQDLYNEDFFEKSDRIIEFLSSSPDERDSNGIIVLQGIHGTGKTNYIRHLIRILNKKIIFLPPELSTELANPGFVTFLMNHPDSILIIEDAETVLKTREAGGNQAVANLLNMSDGILGDALSLQIICTLNADSEHIDKALLREGRLVELYEFKELSKEKTVSLFHKIHGNDIDPPEEEMTLSQIFKYKDYKRNKEEKPDKIKLGFY